MESHYQSPKEPVFLGPLLPGCNSDFLNTCKPTRPKPTMNKQNNDSKREQSTQSKTNRGNSTTRQSGLAAEEGVNGGPKLAKQSSADQMPPPPPGEAMSISQQATQKLEILQALKVMSAAQMGEQSTSRIKLSDLSRSGSEVRIGAQRLTTEKLRKYAEDVVIYLLPSVGPDDGVRTLLAYVNDPKSNPPPAKGTLKRGVKTAKMIYNYVLTCIIADVSPRVDETYERRDPTGKGEQVVIELRPEVMDKRRTVHEYVNGHKFKEAGMAAVSDFKSRVQSMIVPTKAGGLTPEAIRVKKSFDDVFRKIREKLRHAKELQRQALIEEEEARYRMEKQIQQVQPDYTIRATSGTAMSAELGFSDGAAEQTFDAQRHMFEDLGFEDFDGDGDLNE